MKHPEVPPTPVARPTDRPRLTLLCTIAVGLLAAAAALPSIRNGFAFDDVPIVVDNPAVHTLQAWWRIFGLPYWPPRFGASLYRPVTVGALALQWVAGGGAPWVFHAVNIALYAIASALVFRLFLLLLPLEAAVVGAALFAVHPVHVEAVANVVGQAELIAGTAIVGALILYLRERLAGRMRARAIGAIAALFGIACLAKEHAALLPALLIAMELLAVPGGSVMDARTGIDRGPDAPATPGVPSAGSIRSRVALLAPLHLTLALVGIAYLTVRTLTLHSLLGEKPVVPVFGLARIGVALAAAPHWVRLLVWPAHLSADYSPRALHVPSPPWVDIAAGVAVLSAAIAAGIALGIRAGRPSHAGARRAALIGLVLTAIALLPVSNLFTVMLLAERTLFVPSIGAMLVVSAAVAAASMGRDVAPRRWALRAAILVLVALGLARSRARQPVWRDDATLFAQTVRDVPESYRAHFLYGQLLFEQGRRAEGERELRRAIALNPVAADVSPLNYLATQYRMAGMCPQALPLYERALRDNDSRVDVRYGLSACLIALGQPEAARRLAEAGVSRGQSPALFRGLIASADSAERARHE